MNLPNTLTTTRIILTMAFVLTVIQNGVIPKILAALIFAVASLTDYLDGYYAKKHNLVSNFGKLMDPIADKFLILAAFFIFARMHVIALWMFAVIFFREIIVTVFRLIAVGKGEVLAAEKAGKYKTCSQMAVIGFILLFLILRESYVAARWPTEVFYQWYFLIYCLMAVTMALTLVSGALYLWRNRRTLHV